jgi:hypothetical protein
LWGRLRPVTATEEQRAIVIVSQQDQYVDFIDRPDLTQHSMARSSVRLSLVKPAARSIAVAAFSMEFPDRR